jgi:uncharacterized protein YdeI (YjbR/CyaY-like superfamily)
MTRPEAAHAFDALGKTERYAVILRIVTARNAAAREARLSEVIAALEARDGIRTISSAERQERAANEPSSREREG